MRLLSFQIDEKTAFGALVEGRIVDLSIHMPEYGSLRELLAARSLVRALDLAAEASADFNLNEVELLPPLTDPGKILCAFVETNGTLVEQCSPIEGISLTGHRRRLSVTRPASASTLTATAGIAIIIGTPGQNIPESEAQTHIAGLSLLNFIGSHAVADGSTNGMHYLSAGFGPWIVTTDELDSLGPFGLTTSINETAEEHTISGVGRLVSRLSATEILMPGDTIALLMAKPEVPPVMESGDRLAVKVTEIGVLENTIADETADSARA